MRAQLSVLAAGFGMFLAAMPVLAHHSFEAEYDSNKPMKVTGTVTKVEWTNPHARFYVEVKDENGKVANWNFELGSPNVLIRQGWRRSSLKEGDQVTVEGYLAKDGSNLANARRVTLPDGRKVFAGSAAEANQQ
jgi:DNA/RNA endonuclease YhcR with UshA esterase domain